MISKVSQIERAIAGAVADAARYGVNAKNFTERAEELWFTIEDTLDELKAAESNTDPEEARSCLERLARLVGKIQIEYHTHFTASA